MANTSGTEHRALLTVCVMLATIMQALDTTIANVALPYMQGSLSATLDQVNWVLTSYIVAAAIAMPVTGFLVARYGRKAVFLGAVAGFTVASVLCGIAASLEQMVLFRLLQGIFGAPLVPMSQSVLLDSYPKEQHGSAMAIWGVGVMVGPILGPTLGGYLTDTYNWRWVFYINLPVGILTFVGLSAYLSDSARRTVNFDWFGFLALSIAIGSFQMMLDRGEQLDWFSSPEIVIEFVVAGLALYMFLVHTFTAEEPFIDPRMFNDRNFSLGLALIFMVGIILLATLALLTPYLQNLMGYPVLTAGMVLAPRGMGTMVAMMLLGRLINRVDARLLVLLDAERLSTYPRHPRRAAGIGSRFHVRAALHDSFRHAPGEVSHRGDGSVQPHAQHRVQHRHIPRHLPPGTQHADHALATQRAYHSLQRSASRTGRRDSVELGQRGRPTCSQH